MCRLANNLRLQIYIHKYFSHQTIGQTGKGVSRVNTLPQPWSVGVMLRTGHFHQNTQELYKHIEVSNNEPTFCWWHFQMHYLEIFLCILIKISHNFVHQACIRLDTSLAGTGLARSHYLNPLEHLRTEDYTPHPHPNQHSLLTCYLSQINNHPKIVIAEVCFFRRFKTSRLFLLSELEKSNMYKLEIMI